MLASFRGYVLGSLALTTAVISHAVYAKRFFYRAVVHMSSSKLAILAVGNMGLVSFLLLWRAVQAVFLGPLRFREIERLQHRARDAIIECCFAMTIFRDEFNVRFLTLVTVLLLVKSMHWLAKDRIEFLEEQPLTPVRTHVRLVGLMLLLFACDLRLVSAFSIYTFRTRGPTMLVLFAFEFTVLLVDLVSNMVRYVFHLVDLYLGGRWESKGLYTFYNELLSDMCQLTVYVAFFLYVQFFYTFPLHIVRDLYLTFTKFQKRCVDFLRYRRVVATMNEVFPNATEEELAEGDRTCIICREEMSAAKKLSCGHMFHYRCLRSWLKRQLSCPTCRAAVDVLENAPPSLNENPDANNINNNNNNNNGNAPAQPAAVPGDGNVGVPAHQRGHIHIHVQAGQRPAGGPPGQQDNARGQRGQFGQPPRNNASILDIIQHWWNTLLSFAGAAQRPGNVPRVAADPRAFPIPHPYAGIHPYAWRPVHPNLNVQHHQHMHYPLPYPRPMPFAQAHGPVGLGPPLAHPPPAGPDQPVTYPRGVLPPGTFGQPFAHPGHPTPARGELPIAHVHGPPGPVSNAPQPHGLTGMSPIAVGQGRPAISERVAARPLGADVSDSSSANAAGIIEPGAVDAVADAQGSRDQRSFVSAGGGSNMSEPSQDAVPRSGPAPEIGSAPPVQMAPSDMHARARLSGAVLERLVFLQERVLEMRGDLDGICRKFDSLHEELVRAMLLSTAEQLERSYEPVSGASRSTASGAPSDVQTTICRETESKQSRDPQPCTPDGQVRVVSSDESASVVGQSSQDVPPVISEAEALRLRRLEFLNRQQNREGSRTDES